MNVVVTDFGVVKVSAKSIAWLDTLDVGWRKICASKRRRGKHAQWVRNQVRRFEDAVMVAAAIAFNANFDLKEF